MGLCPRCVLSTVYDDLNSNDHPSLNHGRAAGRCPAIETLNAQVKGFKFVELLGRGGSGWTFLALQESLDRQVAVKVMHRIAGNKETVTRFRHEAESLARLNHPGIVTVHDSGVTEDFLYLVMEYVAGPTLRRRLQAGPLTVPQALAVTHQICEAVENAHAAGILHRDIKPENILFESNAVDAKAKVTDFGIAKILTGVREQALTATGMIAGTPFYMAPEQHQSQDQVGFQGDVYSIGVVLYEMLTGQLPLGRFPAPSQLTNCSKAVDRAVFQALQNQPKNRTASSRLLAESLDGTSTRFAWWRWLVAAALLALVLFVGFSLLHDETTQDTPTGIVPKTVQPDKSKVDSDNPFLKNWPVEAAPSKAKSQTVK